MANENGIPFINKITYRGAIKGVGSNTHPAPFDGDSSETIALHGFLYGDGDFKPVAACLVRTYFEIVNPRNGDKLVGCEQICDNSVTHEWGRLGYNDLADGDLIHFVTKMGNYDSGSVTVTVPIELYRTFLGQRSLEFGHHNEYLVRYELTLEVAWCFIPEEPTGE